VASGKRKNETTNWKHWRTITREQYNRFVCHKSNFMIITAEARSRLGPDTGPGPGSVAGVMFCGSGEGERCAIRRHKNGRLPQMGVVRCRDQGLSVMPLLLFAFLSFIVFVFFIYSIYIIFFLL